MRKTQGPTNASLQTSEFEAQEVSTNNLNEFGRPPLDKMTVELNRKAVRQFDLYKNFDGGFLFDLDPEYLPDGYILIKCVDCEAPVILETMIDEGNHIAEAIDQEAVIVPGDYVQCSKCSQSLWVAA